MVATPEKKRESMGKEKVESCARIFVSSWMASVCDDWTCCN